MLIYLLDNSYRKRNGDVDEERSETDLDMYKCINEWI